MENAQENSNNRNRSVYILLLLLLISITGNIVQYFRTSNVKKDLTEQTTNVESLTDFKDQLQKQYDVMTDELEQYKGKNVELDSLLEMASNDIARQKKKIEGLIKQNKDIPLLERQLAEMKAIRDQYRIQIEQLIKENKDLRFANINLSQEVDNLNKTKEDLSQKVELASVLKAEEMAVRTFREKGRGTFEPSDKAKRVSRITTTIALAENKLAKPGKRETYLRIIKPDGYVLTDQNNGSGYFTSQEGRNMEFTLRKNVQYSNQREEIIFDVDLMEEARSGLYISEIYLDGKHIGTYKFNLK